MSAAKPRVCKVCGIKMKPERAATSRYARSLPLCVECEEAARKSVRPSPLNRQEREYDQR